MTIALLVIVALTFTMTFPAWQLARRNQNDSPLVLGLALPAVILWFVLTVNGFGSQSLSNVIEVLCLLGAGVALAYLHLYLVSRTGARPTPTAVWMMVVLVVAAILFRWLMPVLPE